MDVVKYLKRIISRKKIQRGVSWFSFWDEDTILPRYVYLGATARLLDCNIGNYTRIKPGCVLKHVDVGNFCSIANNVIIGLGRHPTNLLSTNSIFYKPGLRSDFVGNLNFKEEIRVRIGHDVWIGNGAVIMDGVSVGNGAIIAARAVVTKDVPSYAIVVGVPAKVVRFRFPDDAIKLLNQVKWWDFSDKEILDVLPVFTKSELDTDTIKRYLLKKNNDL